MTPESLLSGGSRCRLVCRATYYYCRQHYAGRGKDTLAQVPCFKGF